MILKFCNFAGLITLIKNVQILSLCNICDQWSISSIQIFFYKILLTWSKIYRSDSTPRLLTLDSLHEVLKKIINTKVL